MASDDSVNALNIVEWSALGIEMLAIALIVVAIAAATSIYLYGLLRRESNGPEHYEDYKRRLGRALLLCLEILVAADIIRTVALGSGMQSVLALGLLVVVRTFLSWSLILEVEGHWPWQRVRPPANDALVGDPNSSTSIKP